MAKNYVKIDENRRFLDIGVSATSAEYSVPNIRPIFAEYSVFGRTLQVGNVNVLQTFSFDSN